MLKIVSKDGKWSVMSADADEPVLVCDTEEAALAYVANAEKAKKTDSKIRTNLLRVDNMGTLRKPVETAQGYLKVDAFLTRTGVFIYRNDDGSQRREYRPPEEVFDQASIDSFSMAPVTDDHPPVFLDATNTSEYQRGHLSEKIDREGHLMRASMLVTDAALIRKMQSGKALQISNGYRCDLEEKPGVTATGERYDFIQRKIRGNHVAVLPAGRAGPEARVRMDSGADVLVSISGDGTPPPPSPAPENQPVNKIVIAGVEYDAGSAQAVAAQNALQTKLDAEAKQRADADKARAEELSKLQADAKALKEESERNKARADKATEDHAKLEKELKDAPAKIAGQIKARMQLEANALKLSPKIKKIDSLDDKAIKVLVIKELNPGLKLDGRDDAYIDARFDLEVEQFDESDGEEEDAGGEDGVTAARRAVTDSDDDETSDPGDPENEMSLKEANEKHTDSATAYEAMCVRGRNMWREPIGTESSAE